MPASRWRHRFEVPLGRQSREAHGACLNASRTRSLTRAVATRFASAVFGSNTRERRLTRGSGPPRHRLALRRLRAQADL